MAVAQVGSTSIGNAAAGTTVTCTLPNTATAGNLLIIEIGLSAANTRTAPTVTGWTLVQSGAANPSSAGMLWVYSKVAVGGETSIAVTWTGTATPGYRAFEFSGADTTTPVVAAPAFTVDTSTGATLALSGTTRTTAAANEFQLAVCGGRGITTATFNTHSFGGGYTETTTTGTSSAGVAGAATRSDVSSGTVITPTFTFTNLQGSPVTIFGNISIAAAVSGTFTGSASVTGTATIAAAGSAGGSASVAATATIAASGSAGLTRTASLAATATITAAGVVTGAGPVDAQLSYKVEIDLSGSAFGTAFSAFDVTSSAVAGLGFEPYTISWGRQDQFSSVNPTTVSGSLLNTDGTYSPGNPTNPDIRRGLRRRVSATVAGQGTVHLSEDYATSLEVVPAQGAPAVTNIEGADILARFGSTSSSSDPDVPSIGTTMRSFLAEEMMLDSPSMFFVMQEGAGSTAFGNLGSDGQGLPLTVVNSRAGAGVVSAGQTPTGTFAAGTVVGITNANYGTATRGGSWLATRRSVATSPTTIEAWVQMPAAVPGSVSARLATGSDTGGVPVDISVDTSGRITANSGDLVSSANLCDGKVHQVVVVLKDGASILYVDGASVATSTTTPVPFFGFAMTVGMFDDGLGGSNPFSGSVAYFAAYAGVLSSTRITAHYNAGATAFAGLDTTDQRVTRLLSYRANTGANLDAGLSLMGLQTIAGRSLQDCLFEVGTVEAGAVYVDGTGRVNMRSRSRAFNPAVTATFDMSAGGVNFGSNWREDTQGVINDVSVTNQTTGSEQRFYNAASIALDGEFSTSVQIPAASDAAALDIAGWMVANGIQPQITATPLILDLLHLSPAQAYAALQLAPLDVVRLTNCPVPAPSSTMTFVVQGGTISLGADAATQTLNLSPMPPAVAVWDSTNWDATTGVWAF